MSVSAGPVVQLEPLKKAIGTGASGTGLRHWWLQRLTAIALVPLVIWFLFFVIELAGKSYAEVLVVMGAPLNAMLLIVLVGCIFWHGVLGLDVIVQDYVHAPALELGLRIVVRFGASLIGLGSVMAILAIWLGGRG